MKLSTLPNNSLTDMCIILDIDNTLIHAVRRENNTLYNENEFKIDLKDADDIYIGIKRPYLTAFIKFIFEHFKLVCIWSLGNREYVHSVVNALFVEQKPHAIFSREDSPFIYNTSTYTKPIVKISKCNDICRQYMSLKNTIIIDDLYTNFNNNEDNGILIPRFEYTKIKEFKYNDIDLLKLMLWLQKNHKEDLIKIDKSKIF
jgi:hypothetical protein